MAKNKFDTKKELNKWLGVVSTMESVYEKANGYFGWDRFGKYFKGDYQSALNLSIAPVVVNEVHARIRASVSSLYTPEPYITVTPTKTGNVSSCKIKEQAINAYWREKKVKRQIVKTILQSKITGFSYIKVGYTADLKEVKSEVEGEVNEFIENEDIYTIQVPYTNIYYDPDAKDPLYDARWVIHWYLKPTKYLQDKYGISEIKPTYTSKGQKGKTGSSKNLMEYSKVCEAWDKDSLCKFIFTDGYDKGFLEVVESKKKGCIGPYEMQGFPFIMLYWEDILDNNDGNGNFPFSEVKYIEPQVLEKIKIRSMQMNHIKRLSRQLLLKKGAMDKPVKEMFENAVDGQFLEVEGNPSETVASVPYPPLQLDVYPIESRIDSDLDRVYGQPSTELGVSAGTKSDTLGELKMMNAGTTPLKIAQADKVKDLCVEVASKVLSLMKQFYDIDRYTEIYGEMPEEVLKELTDKGKFDGVSIQYNKDDIKGEERLKIAFGSTYKLDRDGRMNRILQAAKVGVAFGLTPDSVSSKVLGAMYFRDLDLVELEKAFKLDIMNAMEAQNKPDPMKILKVGKMQKDLQKADVDTELKKQRTTSVNLANVGKAIKNARDINGEDEAKATGK